MRSFCRQLVFLVVIGYASVTPTEEEMKSAMYLACRTVTLLVKKYARCDEAALDEVTREEFTELKETYRTTCLPCEPEDAKKCGTPDVTDSTEVICKSMDCTISALGGCKVDVVETHLPNTTLEKLTELRDRMCTGNRA